ncbi:hypothetical protein CYMTET_41675 [Cymbomonas tetramitiformis]|uniref:Protein kinase domain-containing protein n=1 Tax=Cymbomonas tetramitiformis TaxID=36881 RepID=A0AAE0C6Y5_9CHLO|nr:hypothetical protein CYMTET_41675 [Cymbomonas tetramitiformis]
MPSPSYELPSKSIAKGAQARVYKSTIPGQDGVVAIKVFATALTTMDSSSRTEAYYAFAREYGALCRLEHRNILSLVGVAVQDGNLHLITPHAHLEDLHRYFPEAWKACLAERFNWAIQICEGLQHVHIRGLIHCDLKPGNIFMFEDDEIYAVIGDFGMASMFYEGIRHHRELGTDGYKAPEMMGHAGYDQVADIWSLGMVLYKLLLMSDMPAVKISNKVCHSHTEFEVVGSPSRKVTQVLQGCLQVDPQLRMPLDQIITLLRHAKAEIEADAKSASMIAQHQEPRNELQVADASRDGRVGAEEVASAAPSHHPAALVESIQEVALMSKLSLQPSVSSEDEIQGSPPVASTTLCNILEGSVSTLNCIHRPPQPVVFQKPIPSNGLNPVLRVLPTSFNCSARASTEGGSARHSRHPTSLGQYSLVAPQEPQSVPLGGAFSHDKNPSGVGAGDGGSSLGQESDLPSTPPLQEEGWVEEDLAAEPEQPHAYVPSAGTLGLVVQPEQPHVRPPGSLELAGEPEQPHVRPPGSLDLGAEPEQAHLLPPGSLTIGTRVEVHWPLDEAWYAGEIVAVHEDGRCTVHYIDNQRETLNMDKEEYRVLPSTHPDDYAGISQQQQARDDQEVLAQEPRNELQVADASRDGRVGAEEVASAAPSHHPAALVESIQEVALMSKLSLQPSVASEDEIQGSPPVASTTLCNILEGSVSTLNCIHRPPQPVVFQKPIPSNGLNPVLRVLPASFNCSARASTEGGSARHSRHPTSLGQYSLVAPQEPQSVPLGGAFSHDKNPSGVGAGDGGSSLGQESDLPSTPPLQEEGWVEEDLAAEPEQPHAYVPSAGTLGLVVQPEQPHVRPPGSLELAGEPEQPHVRPPGSLDLGAEPEQAHLLPPGSLTIGTRVEVHWPLDEAWYAGEIVAVHEDGRCTVHYIDNQRETLNMDKEEYRVLPSTHPDDYAGISQQQQARDDQEVLAQEPRNELQVADASRDGRVGAEEVASAAPSHHPAALVESIQEVALMSKLSLQPSVASEDEIQGSPPVASTTLCNILEGSVSTLNCIHRPPQPVVFQKPIPSNGLNPVLRVLPASFNCSARASTEGGSARHSRHPTSLGQYSLVAPQEPQSVPLGGAFSHDKNPSGVGAGDGGSSLGQESDLPSTPPLQEEGWVEEDLAAEPEQPHAYVPSAGTLGLVVQPEQPHVRPPGSLELAGEPEQPHVRPPGSLDLGAEPEQAHLLPPGSLTIGTRVEVHWPLDEAWYAGEIVAVHEDGRCTVHYIDNQRETLNMDKEEYRVLPSTHPDDYAGISQQQQARDDQEVLAQHGAPESSDADDKSLPSSSKRTAVTDLQTKCLLEECAHRTGTHSSPHMGAVSSEVTFLRGVTPQMPNCKLHSDVNPFRSPLQRIT